MNINQDVLDGRIKRVCGRLAVRLEEVRNRLDASALNSGDRT